MDVGTVIEGEPGSSEPSPPSVARVESRLRRELHVELRASCRDVVSRCGSGDSNSTRQQRLSTFEFLKIFFIEFSTLAHDSTRAGPSPLRHSSCRPHHGRITRRSAASGADWVLKPHGERKQAAVDADGGREAWGGGSPNLLGALPMW
ncbi:hypothetical protein L1887_47104 [Cichorium endivia]|nr:hypothetical protein L1887_47104 [Cichorium endivia]